MINVEEYEGRVYHALGVFSVALLALLSLFFVTGLSAPFVRSPTERLVTAWLNNLKAGGNGYEYWADTDERASLYSVRDYEILQSTYTSVTARVDSSNAAGMQITKTWLIKVDGDKITDLRESDGNISSFRSFDTASITGEPQASR